MYTTYRKTQILENRTGIGERLLAESEIKMVDFQMLSQKKIISIKILV
jgi:hypothetical protein